MSFPLSPTNGQTAVLNGITYSYSSASTLWTRVTAAVPNTSKSTSSATSPANPNIGDIWYNTTTDDIYRYTSDGVTSYWLDTTGASTTLTTGAASALVVSQPTYAVAFNGTSQYLTTPSASSSLFEMGAGNYTVECWFNVNAEQDGGLVFKGQYQTGATWLPGFGIRRINATTMYFYFNTSTTVGGEIKYSYTGTTSLNTWYHVAMVVISGVGYAFLNGVLLNTGGTSGVGTIGTSATGISVGIFPFNAGNIYFNGSISNLRIIKGTALYTAAFAVPSIPLAAITNTQLLTCQNVPATDASTNNAAVTNVGGASLAIYAAPTVSYASQTLYYRLNSDLAGANVTTVQNVFGVGVTLVGSTVYQFEAVYAFSKAAGVTSHNISLLFGGTATVNNISYLVEGIYNQTSFTTFPSSYPSLFSQTTSSVFVGTGIANATAFPIYLLKGTVSINAGGTFIPQYTLSAAPGGAYTTAAGSYITFTPIGRSGANSSLGTWA
jgi:hypothetical protein